MTKKTIWVLGVDPGLSGALALHSTDGDLNIWDVPTFEVMRGGKTKREIDHAGLHLILLKAISISQGMLKIAFVEKVGAMPKQGVTSMFTFGMTYGALLQAVASVGISTEHVTPQKWKKEMNLRKGKDASRMRASELLPGSSGLWPLVKHHNRAEAALIAAYGLKQQPRSTRRRLGKHPAWDTGPIGMDQIQ